MRDITAAFILIGPAVILTVDAVIWIWHGSEATITTVVRGWHEKSSWPELAYIAIVTLLYVHLFWRAPECWWEK